MNYMCITIGCYKGPVKVVKINNF